jgi:transcriptional regulator with XRE-family HTH domain
MKAQERTEARRLRRAGWSVKAIAREVGVSVSSVSRWVRDIELTPDQRAALAAVDPSVVGHPAGAIARRAYALEQRRVWQEEGRAMARRGDPLHRAGCFLYWAEGTKSRNVAALTNADADLLRVFRRFLAECYDVPDERLAFSVNCFLGNGLSLEEIEAYWLETLELPATCLRASIVNRPSSASRRRGRTLVYGTGRLSVASTAVVQSIYGAIQEYAMLDRPEWLG